MWLLQISTTLDPCDNIFDYYCEEKPVLRLFNPRNEAACEIEEHQGYTNTTTPGSQSFTDVVDLTIVSKWLVEIFILKNGKHVKIQGERHKAFLTKSKEDQMYEIMEIIEPVTLEYINKFYLGLNSTVTKMRELKLPISRKNPFYHEEFEKFRMMFIDNIKKYSRISNDEKEDAIERLMSQKPYFAFFNYNNVSKWEETKEIYEKEYHQMKSKIRQEDLALSYAEKAIRIAAAEKATSHLREYISEFSERFVFQLIIGTSTLDCFNYEGEIHFGTLARFGKQSQNEYLPQFRFVIAHELGHAFYDLQEKIINPDLYEREEKCVNESMTQFSINGNNIPGANYNPQDNINEDFANMWATRLVLQDAAASASNNDDIRKTVEVIFKQFCNMKFSTSSTLNPALISYNFMMAQLPTFKQLYNCKPGDRMYIEDDQICTSLDTRLVSELYEPQVLSMDDLKIVSESMKILEETADDVEEKIQKIEDGEVVEEEIVDLVDISKELPINEEEDDEVLVPTVTEESTEEPTAEPIEGPTDEPTVEPTEVPTEELTEAPTEEVAVQPTAEPILVDLRCLLKWYNEIDILFGGHVFVNIAHKESHKQRFKKVIKRLSNANISYVNVYYNALVACVEILTDVKPPISKRNTFLHWVFKKLKNATIQEIEDSRSLNQTVKKNLINRVLNTHTFFALYDFNNVTVLQEAKTVFEREYHRKKLMLSKEDLQHPLAEIILRLGAIEESMGVLRNYVDKYIDRFIFQAIVANPTNDAFQYLNNNHITVITRNDLKKPKKALADTIFVTIHELLHNIYPHGKDYMPSNVYETAFNCTAQHVKRIGESDQVKWFNYGNVHEDVVNIMAWRLVMKLSAQESYSDDELKATIETIMSGLCRQSVRKNSPIPFHHPLEISLNSAVAQYPLFQKLYKCTKTDRLYVEQSEMCKPFGDEENIAKYHAKGSSESLGFFDGLLENARRMNFTYEVDNEI
ncbi:unnamed protein product [Caenorhabditis bovis]|uniref:Uncharacterized protein n=1 Tax=Caenorhabditis bovis TaxID=2654633 RepID=A0A8S1FEA5_9PELO|nr:unnamed protein product [Caenorhabditis bovis]